MCIGCMDRLLVGPLHPFQVFGVMRDFKEVHEVGIPQEIYNHMVHLISRGICMRVGECNAQTEALTPRVGIRHIDLDSILRPAYCIDHQLQALVWLCITQL